MDFVPRLLRLLMVGLVVAACAGQPIALDACSAACEAARSAAVAPPCHHATASAEKISQPDRPCGQDHAVVPAAAATGAPPQAQTAASATVSVSAFGHTLRPAPLTSSSQSPPPVPFSVEASAALRI